MSRKRNLSAVKTIPEAVEAVIAEAEEISPSQLAHLQKVYAEAQRAQENLQKAIAEHQAAIGARQSFMVFLFGEYGLSEADLIELETGKIDRKS